MAELSADAQKVLAAQSVVRIGDVAPDFSAVSQLGPMPSFYDFIGEGNWGILFSHPAAFTPVCTTELGQVALLEQEWAKRKVKFAAISCDTVEGNTKWVQDINELQKCNVNFPIIADSTRTVSVLYGMLDRSHLNATGMPYSVRSVFFIDPSHIVRAIITYPAPTGRNFAEILRVLDSLQLAFSHKVATPADWIPGKDTVVLPTVPTDDAVKLFPKGVNVVRPWLRYTPDPKN